VQYYMQRAGFYVPSIYRQKGVWISRVIVKKSGVYTFSIIAERKTSIYTVCRQNFRGTCVQYYRKDHRRLYVHYFRQKNSSLYVRY